MGWEESDSLTVSIIVMLVIGPLTIGAYYLVLNAIRLMLALVIYLDGSDGSKLIKVVFNIFTNVCILDSMDITLIIPGIIKSFSYSMTYFIFE